MMQKSKVKCSKDEDEDDAYEAATLNRDCKAGFTHWQTPGFPEVACTLFYHIN